MGVCGIVAEYNPLHNGHLYHLTETRNLLGQETALVVIMSGNFVQRGDFALLDKYVRAEAAVRSGADLVLELPFPFSIGSADRFAFGAMSVLSGIGIADSLSFGCEMGSAALLYQTADVMKTAEFKEHRQKYLNEGHSFAEANSLAAEQCIGEKASSALHSPGDTLGIAYITALAELNSAIQAIAVKRKGAGHDSRDESDYPSASFIRKQLKAGQNIEDLPVPAASSSAWKHEVDRKRAPNTMEQAERAILGRLRLLSAQDYAMLPDMSEGLDARLFKAVSNHATLAEIIEAARTRRYSQARIRRSILYAALGVEKSDFALPPSYTLALAFNERGRALIRESGEKGSLPILTRPAAARKLGDSAWNRMMRDMRADAFYALGRPSLCEESGDEGYRRIPSLVLEMIPNHEVEKRP